MKFGADSSSAVTALAVYRPGKEYRASDSTSVPLLFAAFADCAIRCWDLAASKARPVVLKGHRRTITCLAVHDPSAVLVSGSEDYSAIVWNALTGEQLRCIAAAHQQPITALAVDSVWRGGELAEHSTWLFTGSADKTVAVTDSVGQLSAPEGHTGAITAIAVLQQAPDESAADVSAADALLHVVTAGSGDYTAIVVWSKLNRPGSKVSFYIRCQIPVQNTVYALAMHVSAEASSDIEILASVCRGVLAVWDLWEGRQIRSMEAEGAHSGEILSLAMYAPSNGSSPAMVVTGGSDGITQVLNYKAGSLQHTLQSRNASCAITCMAVFIPIKTKDNKVLLPEPALVTGSSDGQCTLWDLDTKQKLRSLLAPSSRRRGC